MQPFPDEVKLSHTAILHNQLTEVQSLATFACLAHSQYNRNIFSGVPMPQSL
jgi:hypothetical protein